MLHIGLDDTDSLRGGCTTWLATRLLEAFPELDLIGPPRLVRLNPNVPWKTRGNGAVALTLGRGVGEAQVIGALPSGPVKAYARGDSARLTPAAVLTRALAVVEAEARPSAEPGVVVTTAVPPPTLYWQGVRDLVPGDMLARALEGVAHAGLRGGRGLTGAACALAWPGERQTWELLAYRHRERWGRPREISRESVAAAARLRGTFACSDDDGTVAMVPRSPCPVLWGLRGTAREPLLAGPDLLGPEPPARWLLWRTNQATDDHLQRIPLARARDGQGVRVTGSVVTPPEAHRGGHRFFTFADDDGTEAPCAAYEPSGDLRQAVDGLAVGDRIEVCASLSQGTLNLEKIRVCKLAPRHRRPPNPRCPECGARTHSAGRNAGYRCRECGVRMPAPPPEPMAAELAPGWYEPPPSARRHLARPVSLPARPLS